MPEFTIGTVFKLWPEDTEYVITNMAIVIGEESGNWMAIVEYREDGVIATEKQVPLFMFEELIKSSDIYLPEGEEFVAKLMAYRGKKK
jgi:hypothetical protein